MNRFRGGLVFKAHRLVYHSTLGSKVITKKKEEEDEDSEKAPPSGTYLSSYTSILGDIRLWVGVP